MTKLKTAHHQVNLKGYRDKTMFLMVEAERLKIPMAHRRKLEDVLLVIGMMEDARVKQGIQDVR